METSPYAWVGVWTIRAQYSWPRVELSCYKWGLDGRKSQTSWPCLHGIKLLQHKVGRDKKYSGLTLLGRNCSLRIGAGGEKEPCLPIHICPEKSFCLIVLVFKERAGHGSNTTDCWYSYWDVVDFLELVFLHLMYALRTTFRDFKWLGFLK